MSFETGEWSLAKDKELIDKLEKRSAEFLEPLVNIPKNLDELSTETAQLNLLLQNVIGDLNTLSEKRFIENRVAETHDEKTPLTPEPEARPATDDELRLAVRTGLKAFGLLPVEELSDDDQTGYECFAQDRPFSLIIGSKEWLEADPFEGVTLVDTTSVGGTPISEAMEDLVMPSTSDDVEEATEAETWYQQERASISTQGAKQPQDSDSESSVTSATPARSTVPPQASERSATDKPRGLFDEDTSDDDDGDLFGVVRKPSVSSVAEKPSRQTSTQPVSRRESAASLLQESTRTEPKTASGPVSFLDELKKKTGQRNSDKPQNNVKSPLTVSEDDKKLPPLPELPQTQPVAQKIEGSVFDSDPEGDIFASKPQPSKSLSEAIPRSSISLSKTEKSRRASNDTLQPRKPTLLDSDSEEETITKNVSKKPSLPNITRVLPTLPKKDSLFGDSDSDSDIFNVPKTVSQKVVEQPQASRPVVVKAEDSPKVVKPKEFKGVRVLPQLPTKPDKETNEQGKSLSPPFDEPNPERRRSSASLTTRLESVAKPTATSDSEEERNEKKINVPAVRPKQLPTKQPNLFGDSDSDDDLFGNSAKIVTAKTVPKKTETLKKISELPPARETSEQANKAEKSEQISAADEESARSATKSKEITATKKSEKTTAAAPKTLDVVKPDEDKRKIVSVVKTESSAHESSNSSSSDSDSGGDFRQKLKVALSKNPSKPATSKQNVDDSKKNLGDELSPTLDLPAVDETEPRSVDLKQDSSEVGEASIEFSALPSRDETTSDMAEKSGTVKKIGMGLPAGFLQGLKARQQQLGIAQPDRKTQGSNSESGTTEAEPVSIPSPRSPSETQIAMKSEHKDIVEIAKSRARGPTGRRLPSKSSKLPGKSSELVSREEKKQIESAQATDVVETHQTVSGTKIPTEVNKSEQSKRGSVVSDPLLEALSGAKEATFEQNDSNEPAPGQKDSNKPAPEQKDSNEPAPKQKESEKLVPTQKESEELVPSQKESEKLVPKKKESEKPARDLEDSKKPAAPQVDSEKSTANKLKPKEAVESAQPAPSSKKNADQKQQPMLSRPKSKSIFASDSSDEDLFSPKAPIRKKSLQEIPAARPITKSAVSVQNDPLSAALATDSEKFNEQQQPVAPKRAAKSSSQIKKTEAKPSKASSKSLFSESEDDDGGQLFASTKTKVVPKSATTPSLTAAAKDKPKMVGSKSSSSNLFGSDSDSDDLFKRK